MTTLDPHQAARHVPPSYGEAGLLSEAPALSDREWPPEGTGIEELDDLRAEHERLIDAAVEVGNELAEVRRRHEEEDREYADALRAQAAGQKVKIPELTPPAERAAELAPLEAKARANYEVREAFAQRAIETIKESYGDFVDVLDEREGEAEARVEAARRQLAEAEAEVGATVQLRQWLARTAGHSRFRLMPERHIQYAALAPKNTTNEENDQ